MRSKKSGMTFRVYHLRDFTALKSKRINVYAAKNKLSPQKEGC